MTENQLYTSFRNEQTTNPCDCANQDILFDFEKYSPYLDKIRALFVPSLEYRVLSLLEEFVYSTNSRWAKQFSYFKKFVDAIVMWKDPLNRIADYDISTVEEMMKNSIKHMIKDDLNTCFLDSVILHHRLTKVCRELDALGIEDNILRSLNVWNFANEQDYLLDRNCFTDFNTTTDCNMNLNTVAYNAEGSIKCKKSVKPLAKNVYDKNIEHVRPMTSEYRKFQQIPDSNKNFLRPREDNSNHYSTCVITGLQNNSTDKINKCFNKKSCNTESKKIRNGLKLKIIVHKVYLGDYEYLTFSNYNVTRLSLPCKPSNLIRRIFEANPSLTESCLIVMKRKFEDSMYNVCSCLNSVLEKLNIRLTKALCLNCEIYPGYISFKLKAGNIKKSLFVARVPICQNVHKYTIQSDLSILSSSSNSRTENNKSKCFEGYKDAGTSFNNTLEQINEETKKFNTHCSQSDRSLTKDMAIDMSQNETENSNEKKVTCVITENVSRYVQNLAISSCKDMVEKISNMSLCIDNSEERNGEYCKVLNSTEPNYNNDMEKCCKRILESSNSITENDTFKQLVNNANCMCSSRENFIETNNEIEDIFSNKDLDSFSQTTGTNEHDWTCSSNKKSNPENGVRNINTCSITSFVQNSEYDKQLVELNCNCFSSNNINVIDTQKNESSLNSVKVETECNPCCSCRCDDFIDITLFNDISKDISKEIFDVKDGTQNFVSSPRRFSASKRRFRSNGDSRSSGISSTKEYLRAENHSTYATSNASLYRRSFTTTNEFAMSDRRDEVRKFDKSKTLSKYRRHGYVRPRNDIRNVTSTTIKHKTTSDRYPKNYPTEARPQMILAMTKFRNSVDKSVDRIKRLIRAKLGRILFSDNISNNNEMTFWRNKKCSDVRRKKSGKYVRQDYSVTSCSTCNCYRRGYTTNSSRKSSNLIPSIYRTKGKGRSEENIKYRDHISANNSKALLSLRSIKTSPWSDLLTSTIEDIEKQKLNKNNRPQYDRKKKIGNVINYSKNSYRCDLKNSGISITISSQSTEVSLTENDSKYFKHYVCKRPEKTREYNKRIYKQVHNQDQRKNKQVRSEYEQYENKNKYRGVPIKYSNVNSNESLKTPLSHTWRGNARNMHEPFYDISKLRNIKRFASSRKNQQIFEKNMSDRNLRKKVFAILIDTCNDYTDDLDLDFKLKLSRYIELCKSIKRSLMRTLQPDNICEVSTISVFDSDL